MQPSQFNDDFTLFPYRSDFKNDRTNNGGIDLTREPHRLFEISEAANFLELRQFIIDLNDAKSPFITLGCEAGQDEGEYVGYIEFSFRDEQVANNIDFIANLDQEFYAWCRHQNLQIAEAICNALVWEYSSYTFHGTSRRMKIAFFYHALDQHCAGQILDLVRHYLMTACSIHLPMAQR